MLWYVRTATSDRAYADQELKSWDGVKGTLPKATIDARRAKVDAGKQDELKAAFAAEASAHILPTFDAKQSKVVDVALDAPVYACAWDGVAPYVTTLAGTFPAEGVPVMGWPQTDVAPDVPAFDDSGVAPEPVKDAKPAEDPARDWQEWVDANTRPLGVDAVAIVRE